MKKMNLLIYLPALNEEDNILYVLQNLPKKIDGIDRIDYLVVDDGSTDRTAELAKDSGANVISHHNKKGVGGAFQSAIRYALENSADILVGIDADGQFDSSQIPDLIEPILTDKADMVIGNRFKTGKPEFMSQIKYWGNKQVARLVYLVGGKKFQDVSCGFRSYNRESLFRLNLLADFTYTHEAILSLVFQDLRVLEFPVSVKYDPDRKSRVAGSIVKYAYQTIKIIIRMLIDYSPMRVFGFIGSIINSIGICFILFLLGHYFITGSFFPYRTFGFIGLGFIVFGMFVLIIGMIYDVLNRVRMIQDKQLYEIKKLRYKD